MELNERTAEEVGLYLMGMGLEVEGEPIWIDNGWGLVVSMLSFHISETMETIWLKAEGEQTNFARIDARYATPKLLATLIYTVIEEALKELDK